MTDLHPHPKETVMKTEVQVWIAKKKTGRCRSGSDLTGSISHAVPSGGHGWTPAACGSKPGQRGNGWSEYHPEALTCPRCIARLQKQGERNGKMPSVLLASSF